MGRMDKVTPALKDILANDPATRDNDWLLILAYLCTKHGLIAAIGGKVVYGALRQFLMAKGIASAETITRVRRLLQAENEELRGANYKERKTTHEVGVRNWARGNK